MLHTVPGSVIRHPINDRGDDAALERCLGWLELKRHMPYCGQATIHNNRYSQQEKNEYKDPITLCRSRLKSLNPLLHCLDVGILQMPD